MSLISVKLEESSIAMLKETTDKMLAEALAKQSTEVGKMLTKMIFDRPEGWNRREEKSNFELAIEAGVKGVLKAKIQAWTEQNGDRISMLVAQVAEGVLNDPEFKEFVAQQIKEKSGFNKAMGKKKSALDEDDD